MQERIGDDGSDVVFFILEPHLLTEIGSPSIEIMAL